MRTHRAYLIDGKTDTLSPLIQAFVDRASRPPKSAFDIILDYVSALQRRYSHHNIDQFLTVCARDRRICSIEYQNGLPSDGFIEPMGPSIENGFRVVLHGGVSLTRRRFTLAHEICHTFFYEAVPEIKFGVAEEDALEERLCNYGASCLLMPEHSLRQSDLAASQCLRSLDMLSESFQVSPETMILRLRTLGLWRCEYSRWYQSIDGEFFLDKFYGRGRVRWNWADPELLTKAWCSGHLHRGKTAVWQNTKVRPVERSVYYEVERRGNRLIALWHDQELHEQKPPLLELCD